jgi:short-subunit dehydrogenase
MPEVALITGASAGLGAEFARLFAADKHDLVLVARRRDRLDALAGELAKAHGVSAHVVTADLSRPEGPGEVTGAVGRLGVSVGFLVNNAGFGMTGAFAELDAARELEMVNVNVTTLVTLTRAFVPGMIARRRGRILNIGSTAGFQAGPYMAAYYASKAFVNLFTEALSYELRDTGVTATVSCPGATATEFAGVAGNDGSRLFKRGGAPATVVARQAYRAMLAGRPMIVHGLKNRLMVQLLRVSPRAAVRAVAANMNSPAAPALQKSALPK